MISFSQIPALILTPGAFVELDTSQMQAASAQAAQRVVIFGQMLSTGTAAANTLYRIDGINEAKGLFGLGSQLADAIAGFITADPTIELWAIGVADAGGGTAATYTITFTGPSTAAGSIYLSVLGQRIVVPVTSAMTATQAATAVAAAINALPDLPFTATSAVGVVTLTCRHKGPEFNNLFIASNPAQGDVLAAGLTCTIAAGTSGATNPTITSALAGLGDEAFAHVVHPWTDATTIAAVEAAMADRADALKMNYSQSYTAKLDSYSNLITALGSRNSQFGVMFTIKTSTLPQAPWRICAAAVAKIAASSYADPALPFNGLALKGITPPKEGTWFTRQEREFLLEAGGATLLPNAAGQVTIERVVTTYKTNALGYADAGLRDLNSMLTLFYIARDVRFMIATTFPRYKLADDGNVYPAGAKVVTPRTLKAAIVGRAKAEWYDRMQLIENLDQFVADLRVERDPSDKNRVNLSIRPDLINGLQVTAALIQPIL